MLIKLSDAMVLWNCTYFKDRHPEKRIIVVRRSEYLARRLGDDAGIDYLDSKKFRSWFAGEYLESSWNGKDESSSLGLFVELWHIVCRDGVPIAEAHKEFMKILEYRERLSEDFSVTAGR